MSRCETLVSSVQMSSLCALKQSISHAHIQMNKNKMNKMHFDL